MQLYHLAHVPWIDSQLIYHAQPRVGVEALNILAPSTPYVCLGYHQDLEQEIDEAFCRERGIPIFRREVGGGAVYLDGNQIFYQIVLHADHPLAQGGKAAFYKRMLEPVAAAYCDLGVPAHYRPVNDVVTADGRKISGTGAAEIGAYVVLVGNLIADFDYETTARVLRVPDEKYRDKVYHSMRENLTTLRREIGRVPAWDEMTAPLIRRFAQVLGPLEPGALPAAVREQVEALTPRFQSAEWLYKVGRREPGRNVKIASGVNVIQRVHKAPGGLLRATVEVVDGRWRYVSLSGDLFCYPRDAIGDLQSALEGTLCADARAVIEQFYATHEIETPGVSTDDWLGVLPGAS
ncbi:MAG: lipoate--protein ligase family protein [Anaerolineae bacterium]|nr:lipoate--protein ligase family protein [Anaerolineae bacterium]